MKIIAALLIFISTKSVSANVTVNFEIGGNFSSIAMGKEEIVFRANSDVINLRKNECNSDIFQELFQATMDKLRKRVVVQKDGFPVTINNKKILLERSSALSAFLSFYADHLIKARVRSDEACKNWKKN